MSVEPVRVRRGLTLIEAALVLGVAAIVFGGLAEALSVAAENNRSKVAADRLNEVAMAAQAYLKANNTALLKVAGNGLLIPVGRPNANGAIPGNFSAGGQSLPSLQGGGYLPFNFVDQSSYGQTHVFVAKVVNDPANGPAHVEGMVFSDGPAIPDRQLGRVARFLGSEGGFMLATQTSGYNAGTVYGVGGGWTAPATSWSASGFQPAPGHVMALLSANNTALNGDYLSKVDPGPGNAMQVNLQLGDNDLTQVKNITANDAAGGTIQIGPNISVPGYIKAGGDISSGTSVTAPKFVDSDDPRFFVDPASVSNLNQVNAVNAQFGCTNPKATYPNQVLTTCGSNVLGGPTLVGDPNVQAIDPSKENGAILDVKGTGYVDDLRSGQINVDTVIYGNSKGIGPGTGVRLGDLLPDVVAKGQFYWTYQNGAGMNVVPMPWCGTSGHGVPKIQLSILSDNSQFTAPVTSQVYQNGSVISTDGVPAYASYESRQATDFNGTPYYVPGDPVINLQDIVTSVKGGPLRSRGRFSRGLKGLTGRFR